jgi:hypothetical protein
MPRKGEEMWALVYDTDKDRWDPRWTPMIRATPRP